jgi:hypothetical protein
MMTVICIDADAPVAASVKDFQRADLANWLVVAVAGHRLRWLMRLARAGQPAPERIAYARKHFASDVRTQLARPRLSCRRDATAATVVRPWAAVVRGRCGCGAGHGDGAHHDG